MSEAVTYQRHTNGIAIITIDRPESRNCLSQEVRDGLKQAWQQFENDNEARVGILTGSGTKAFCAGGDLKAMVESGMKVPPRDFLSPTLRHH